MKKGVMQMMPEGTDGLATTLLAKNRKLQLPVGDG